MGAPFSTMKDADTVGWAVRRNQDFAASKLGGEVGHFKRDVRHSPDEIGNRRVRFEAHPFHAEFAFLVTDDKELQIFQVGLPRPRFRSGNPDVMIPAHGFLSPLELAPNSTLFVAAFESCPVASLPKTQSGRAERPFPNCLT